MMGMRLPGMAMAAGANAAFAIEDELKAAVTAACEADSTRAIKVVIDTKGEKLKLGDIVPAGATMEEDFKNIDTKCEDGVACLFLAKLKPAAGDDAALPAEANDWALFCWIPDDCPPKPKMLAASTQKTVKTAFAEQVTFKKDYKMTDRSETTFAAWKEENKKLEGEDRLAAMTLQERMALETKEASEKERAAAPQKQQGLAGLGSITCTAHESFDDGVKKVASESGLALQCKITGKSSHQVEGDILQGISKPSDLKGKLTDDVPCYVLMPGEDGLVLISWCPPTSAVKPRMHLSTYQKCVIQKIKDLTGKDEVLHGEAENDDELVDDLGKKVVESDVPQAQPQKPKPAGPMAGAFKLPGMK